MTENTTGGRRFLRGAAFRRATWKWSVGWFAIKVLTIPATWIVIKIMLHGADGWYDLNVHYGH